MKIQNAVVAFPLGEARGKVLRQPQQRRHLAADPVPILGQRVAAIFDRSDRGEKFCLVKNIAECRAQFSSIAFGITGGQIGGSNLPQNFRREFAGKLVSQTLKNAEQFGGLFVVGRNAELLFGTFVSLRTSGRSGDRRSEIFQNRQPLVAPILNRGEQPLLPFGGFVGGKLFDLSGEPAFGIGPGLRVVVQAQNQRTDFFVARAAVSLNQFLNRRGEFVPAFVLLLQHLLQRLVGQQPRLALVEHGGLRVEAQLVKMLAHELETKTVKRADVRGVKQRELFGKKGIGGVFP